MLHLVLMQLTLGITTLMYMCPIPLAAAHQAGALALLTGALVVGQRLRVPKSTMALVQKALKEPVKMRADAMGSKLMKNIAEKK